jgi:LacI family transcriptional regulator
MKRRQVALLIETSNAYARGLLGGIAAYMREHAAWSIFLPESGRGNAELAHLSAWKGDGIIARIENRRIARAVANAKAPVVDLSAAQLFKGAAWVETDDRAIASLAFSHLRERGFRQLAFCGLNQYNWSIRRRDHFVSLAAEAGIRCPAYMAAGSLDDAADWAADQRDLMRWVRKLPKPVGIMACFDLRGRQLLDACRTADLRVPDDVAVIGVDNDPILCELADPPLSSVEPDSHRTGYIAATLLARMMDGRKVKGGEYPVAPLGVTARRSTDALAIDDPEVAAAVRFIRQHACEGIGVKQLLHDVPISRRNLERRFRSFLGRSPHEEIVRCRIERVRELLQTTDLPLKTIAQRIGVAHAEHVNVMFRNLTGQPPGAYRRQFRERIA